MRPEPTAHLEKCRIRVGPMASTAAAGNNGCFLITGPLGRKLLIVASDGGGWEHVSVSRHKSPEPPRWAEMAFVKDLFWGEEETVVQLHPPRSVYVNNHPGVLHLWRPIGFEVPLPPLIFV